MQIRNANEMIRLKGMLNSTESDTIIPARKGSRIRRRGNWFQIFI
jgi:hypothetical protein